MMYVEETAPGKFAIQDVTTDQMELVMNGLLEVIVPLQRAKVFLKSCVDGIEMYNKIDHELIKSRS